MNLLGERRTVVIKTYRQFIMEQYITAMDGYGLRRVGVAIAYVHAV